jgi:hypothetical protein
MTATSASSPLLETADGIDFSAMIEPCFHPIGVRDRIVLPDNSPTALDDAVGSAVDAYTRRPGRHNRYVPVPGELALRTDDLVDFLFVYGHEYQLGIFRAVDIRTGGLLHLASVEAEAQRQQIATIWDWTGAADWLPAAAIPVTTSAVFWSDAVSLVDGARIPAGTWRPADGEAPAALTERPWFSSDEIVEMRALAAAFAEGWMSAAQVVAPPATPALRHPGQFDPGLPTVVIDSPSSSAVHDRLLGADGVAAIDRRGDRMTILLSGIDSAAAVALGAAAATTGWGAR